LVMKSNSRGTSAWPRSRCSDCREGLVRHKRLLVTRDPSQMARHGHHRTGLPYFQFDMSAGRDGAVPSQRRTEPDPTFFHYSEPSCKLCRENRVASQIFLTDLRCRARLHHQGGAEQRCPRTALAGYRRTSAKSRSRVTSTACVSRALAAIASSRSGPCRCPARIRLHDQARVSALTAERGMLASKKKRTTS